MLSYRHAFHAGNFADVMKHVLLGDQDLDRAQHLTRLRRLRLRLARCRNGNHHSGQSGNEIFNGKKAVRFGVDNFETSYLDRWTGPGTSNTEPRVTNAGHNYQSSERFIEDGSFFKLNSAQLGYRLPETVTGRMMVESARLYVNGTNLFTLTDYSGYTPEIVGGDVINTGIDRGVYPAMRTLTVGVDVTF